MISQCKKITRICLYICIIANLIVGAVTFADGYFQAKRMHDEGQLNMLSGCFEVTYLNSIAAMGFKLYLNSNTDIMDEIRKMHRMSPANR